MWNAVAVIILTAYLLGNINGSVCISQIVAHDDVRKHGSGNAGLTNFFRSYGSWSTLLVLLIDAGKTVLACLVGRFILAPYGYATEGAVAGAVAVSVGHDFPALLGFKGGKGIVCGFSVAAMLDWRIALAVLAVFVIAFAITRYVSLGSVLGAITFVLGFVALHSHETIVMLGGICLGLLAIFMHRSNIVRLLQGKESKVHLIRRDLNKG